jgi:hypothetical protein
MESDHSSNKYLAAACNAAGGMLGPVSWPQTAIKEFRVQEGCRHVNSYGTRRQL